MNTKELLSYYGVRLDLEECNLRVHTHLGTAYFHDSDFPKLGTKEDIFECLLFESWAEEFDDHTLGKILHAETKQEKEKFKNSCKKNFGILKHILGNSYHNILREFNYEDP